MFIIDQVEGTDISRSDAFSQFADRRSRGEVIVPPTMLSKEERRHHIRQTMREDHQFRIHNRPEGAQAKFDKLAKSAFKFFRGTALLYYRDYAGTDGHLPTVLTIGDVHPENFGVMPNADGTPFFGANDFDEAHFAPYTWDVKRGAVGFYIVAKENGLSKKKRRKVVKSFVKGYIEGLVEFARDDREKWHQYRIDNSPKMIKELLESARSERKEFLEEMIDIEKGEFIPTDEIVPRSRDVKKFQKIIDKYSKDNGLTENGKAGHFKVKDVAIKKDSGTASLGLDRYFVLIDGPTDDNVDDVVLEIKQARKSALYGLVPDSSIESEGEADRIVESHDIHLVAGDPYYGNITIDDQSFLIKERSPFKDGVDVDDLDYDGLKEYARICGKTLSQTHARSDEDTGVMEGDAEKRILATIQPDLFIADVTRFAKAAAKRIYGDYKLFKEDHAMGAFNFVSSE
ncbi:MAG: DUF2252 family protein [Anaerolineae bacterium]|nr:DUF2252 family protein [Anaerolineae bacterium]